MPTFAPLIDLTALQSYAAIYILGRSLRTHRLARLCTLVGKIKIAAFIDHETPQYESPQAPAMDLASYGAHLPLGKIAILCDAQPDAKLAQSLTSPDTVFFEARYTLNLFFPEVYDDHLLDDVSFLRLWQVMFGRRGLAASVRAQEQLPYLTKINYDAVARPYYAYVLSRAGLEARQLGITEISVFEFGVAGGNGLLNIEQHANALEDELGIHFHIVGFDTGKGLPSAGDIRDQQYIFQSGDYPMDEAALRARLTRSDLVLGDLAETTSHFWDSKTIPPVGAVMFDLDYYSSTLQALNLLAHPKANRMPRITCYFDDISWNQHIYDCMGELQAIKDFNAAQQNLKVAQVLNLSHVRVQPATWNDQIFTMHDFQHPDYNTPLRAAGSMGRLDLARP